MEPSVEADAPCGPAGRRSTGTPSSRSSTRRASVGVVDACSAAAATGGSTRRRSVEPSDVAGPADLSCRTTAKGSSRTRRAACRRPSRVTTGRRAACPPRSRRAARLAAGYDPSVADAARPEIDGEEASCPRSPDARYAVRVRQRAPVAAPRQRVVVEQAVRRSSRAAAGLQRARMEHEEPVARRGSRSGALWRTLRRAAATIEPLADQAQAGELADDDGDTRLALDELGHASRAGTDGDQQGRARSAPVGERPSTIVEREQPRGPEPARDEQRRRTAPVRRRQRLGGGEEIVRAHLPAQRARPPAGATLEKETDPCADRSSRARTRRRSTPTRRRPWSPSRP